jgi:hypothetical protein
MGSTLLNGNTLKIMPIKHNIHTLLDFVCTACIVVLTVSTCQQNLLQMHIVHWIYPQHDQQQAAHLLPPLLLPLLCRQLPPLPVHRIHEA